MEKILKVSKNEMCDFGFLFKEWNTFINSIDNDKRPILRSKKFLKSISVLEKIIKKTESENNLIKVSNGLEGVNFLYEKIRRSILKDFLINDRECYILSAYLYSAITFNLDSFSNVFYILEKIIKNIFEDCGMSTITRKSSENNLTSACSTNLIGLLNEGETFKKVLKKYRCIGFLRYTHGKEYEGKPFGKNIRTSVMKKNTYDLYNMDFRGSLVLIALFILSLTKMPRRYYFKLKEDLLLPEKNIDFTSMDIETFKLLLKNIENQKISLTYEDMSNIQYYIFENNINYNLVELRNKMNILIKTEVKPFMVNDNFFFENSIKPYLKENNISEIIDIYKNLHKGKEHIEGSNSFVEEVKYTCGTMGKVYHFKNKEEAKKYSYMCYLYRYFTMYVKPNILIGESSLIEVLNKRGKNLNPDEYRKICSALLNGFNCNFYNCLILHSLITKKIGEQKNKKNKTLEEIKEIEFIDFFNKDIEIFNQMRHGDFAINELEYFGFICFIISVMLFFK